MPSRALFALCFCWAMSGGGLICAAKQPVDVQKDLYFAVNPPVKVHPQNSQNQRQREIQLGASSTGTPLVGLPRLSLKRSERSQPVEEYVLASRKLRIARQHLEAGRDREAVQLLAESLADLIGLQRSSPDFASEVLPQKIREVRLELEKSLERQ